MRLGIKISDELSAKLETWCKRYGMTKSGFVSYALANHINDLEYKENLVRDVAKKLTVNERKEDVKPTSEENLL